MEWLTRSSTGEESGYSCCARDSGEDPLPFCDGEERAARVPGDTRHAPGARRGGRELPAWRTRTRTPHNVQCVLVAAHDLHERVVLERTQRRRRRVRATGIVREGKLCCVGWFNTKTRLRVQ